MNKSGLINSVKWYAGGGAIVITNYFLRSQYRLYKKVAGIFEEPQPDAPKTSKPKSKKNKKSQSNLLKKQEHTVSKTVPARDTQPPLENFKQEDEDFYNETLSTSENDDFRYEDEAPARALDDFVSDPEVEETLSELEDFDSDEDIYF